MQRGPQRLPWARLRRPLDPNSAWCQWAPLGLNLGEYLMAPLRHEFGKARPHALHKGTFHSETYYKYNICGLCPHSPAFHRAICETIGAESAKLN